MTIGRVTLIEVVFFHKLIDDNFMRNDLFTIRGICLAGMVAFSALLFSCSKSEAPILEPVSSITSQKYAALLGRGMDVDWVKTGQGMEDYNAKAPQDFKKLGFSHVRIRIADDISEDLLLHLDRVITDCLSCGLIPVVAYQANDFKENPSDANLDRVVAWWKTVSERYKNSSNLLSFDLIIEVTDELNNQPATLNRLYEKAVAEIRVANPYRIIFISPIVRSDPENLNTLVIPSKANGYLMAEWHFYASGPSKSNPKKLWTTGTEEEKELIRQKIRYAVAWQQKTGIPTWVGAWMAGNYNDGNEYTVLEQVAFATFVKDELDRNKIPFAINSDTHFYNRSTGSWIEEMLPILKALFQ